MRREEQKEENHKECLGTTFAYSLRYSKGDKDTSKKYPFDIKIRIPLEEPIESIKEKGLIYLKFILIGDRLEDVRKLVNRSKYFDSVKRGFQDLLFIGVDFYLPRLLLEREKSTYLAILQVFHLNGNDRFHYIRPKFYYGAQRVIVFFRYSEPASLKSAIKFINEARKYCNEFSLIGILSKDPNMNIIDDDDINNIVDDIKKKDKEISIDVYKIQEDKPESFDDLLEEYVIDYMIRLTKE